MHCKSFARTRRNIQMRGVLDIDRHISVLKSRGKYEMKFPVILSLRRHFLTCLVVGTPLEVMPL